MSDAIIRIVSQTADEPEIWAQCKQFGFDGNHLWFAEVCVKRALEQAFHKLHVEYLAPDQLARDFDHHFGLGKFK